MPPACDSRLRPNLCESTGEGQGIAIVAKKLGTARLRMSERSGSLGVDCHKKCNGIISNKLGAVSRQHKIVGFSVLGRARDILRGCLARDPDAFFLLVVVALFALLSRAESCAS